MMGKEHCHRTLATEHRNKLLDDALWNVEDSYSDGCAYIIIVQFIISDDSCAK
jgi:hypothetical protein